MMSAQRRRQRANGGSGRSRPVQFLFLCFCAVVFFSCLSPALSGAEDIVEVKGLRQWSTTSEYLRVVVDLSGPADFTKGSLANPDRLFFDLKNAKVSKDLQKNLVVNSSLLKSVRVGQFTATTVRIVFDLASGDYDFKVFNLEDPARLVIDIAQKAPGEKKSEIKPDPIPGSIPSTKQELKPALKPDVKPPAAGTEAGLMRRKVVIDPGHGGHDPGAVGPSGLFEKNVVLDIALKVRDILKKEHPEYDVILTRDKDVFIPLPERAKVATRNGADLFLSIHANASPNRQTRGIETYFLNYTDDEEALKVAARENAISVKKMKQVQSELGVILASLNRDRKRDDSLNLAGYIQSSLVSTMRQQYPKINDLKVKQALFYVLVDAQMASALAEVAFISNPEEEKLLADDAYKQKLAYSLTNGINNYFTAAPPHQKLVYNVPSEDEETAPALPKKAAYTKDAPGKKSKSKTVKYARRTR